MINHGDLDLFKDPSLFQEIYRKAQYLDLHLNADKYICMPHNGQDYDVIITSDHGSRGEMEKYQTLWFTADRLFQIVLVFKRTETEPNSGALVISKAKLSDAYIKKIFVPLEEIEHCFMLMKLIVSERPIR